MLPLVWSPVGYLHLVTNEARGLANSRAAKVRDLTPCLDLCLAPRRGLLSPPRGANHTVAYTGQETRTPKAGYGSSTRPQTRFSNRRTSRSERSRVMKPCSDSIFEDQGFHIRTKYNTLVTLRSHSSKSLFEVSFAPSLTRWLSCRILKRFHHFCIGS